MLKKIVNLKNIILLAIIVVLAVIIFEQQPVLDEKVAAYNEAVRASEKIEEVSEEQKLESDMASSASEEENYARSEGYIFPGEKLFSFEN